MFAVWLASLAVGPIGRGITSAPGGSSGGGQSFWIPLFLAGLVAYAMWRLIKYHRKHPPSPPNPNDGWRGWRGPKDWPKLPRAPKGGPRAPDTVPEDWVLEVSAQPRTLTPSPSTTKPTLKGRKL